MIPTDKTFWHMPSGITCYYSTITFKFYLYNRYGELISAFRPKKGGIK